MKKLIVFALGFLFLISTLLSSCTTEPVLDSSSEETSENVSAESSEEELFANLPTKDYGGKDFTILVVGDCGEIYKSVEVMPHETSSETLNNAINTRNDLVEEAFNVHLQEVRTASADDMVTKIRTNAMSGISEYDLVMPYMQDAATCAVLGYFYDLKSLKNIHLDEDYYDADAVSSLSICNQLYFVAGDLCLLDLACTHALEFNKDMIEENHLENPYDLVKNGQWTVDKMFEMAHGVSADTDGISGMGYQDTYGFLINWNFTSSMFIGCGLHLTEKDSEDQPVISLGTEQATNIFNKLYDLINDDTTVGRIDDYSSSYATSCAAAGIGCYVAATESVANKHALFRAICVIDAFDLGEYDCNFGILPVPKLNEEQDTYYSRVDSEGSSCIAIPKNVEDVEMSSIITDALNQASTDTTKQAYFEVILKDRKFQDNESEEILDIIFNSRVFELSYVFGWSMGGSRDFSLGDFMNTVAFASSNTYTSTWESIKDSCQAAIDDTVASYKAIRE